MKEKKALIKRSALFLFKNGRVKTLCWEKKKKKKKKKKKAFL